MSQPPSPKMATEVPLSTTITTFRFPNPATTSMGIEFSDSEGEPDDLDYDDDEEEDSSMYTGSMNRSNSTASYPETEMDFNPFKPHRVSAVASLHGQSALRFSSANLRSKILDLEMLMAEADFVGEGGSDGEADGEGDDPVQVPAVTGRRRKSSQVVVEEFLKNALHLNETFEESSDVEVSQADRDSFRKSTQSVLQFLLDSRQAVSMASVSPVPSLNVFRGTDFVIKNANRMSTAISAQSDRGANRISLALGPGADYYNTDDEIDDISSFRSHPDDEVDLLEKELAGEMDESDADCGAVFGDDCDVIGAYASSTMAEDGEQVGTAASEVESGEALDTIAPMPVTPMSNALPFRPKRTTSSNSTTLRLLTGQTPMTMPLSPTHEQVNEYHPPEPRRNSLKRPSFSDVPPVPEMRSNPTSPRSSVIHQHSRHHHHQRHHNANESLVQPGTPASPNFGPDAKKKRPDMTQEPPSSAASTNSSIRYEAVSSPNRSRQNGSTTETMLPSAASSEGSGAYPRIPVPTPASSTLMGLIINLPQTHFSTKHRRVDTILTTHQAPAYPLGSTIISKELISAAALWRARGERADVAVYKLHACAVAPWIFPQSVAEGGLTREVVHPSAVAMYILAMCLFEGAGCRKDPQLAVLVLEMAAGVAVDDGHAGLNEVAGQQQHHFIHQHQQNMRKLGERGSSDINRAQQQQQQQQQRPSSMYLERQSSSSTVESATRDRKQGNLIVPQRRASLKAPRILQSPATPNARSSPIHFYPLSDPAWSLIDSYGQNHSARETETMPAPSGYALQTPTTAASLRSDNSGTVGVGSSNDRRKSQLHVLSPIEFLRLPTLRLAECHEMGRGTPRSPQKAAYYYQVWNALGGTAASGVPPGFDTASIESHSSGSTFETASAGSMPSKVTDFEAFYAGITGESNNKCKVSALFKKKQPSAQV
ncbi:hypothetical protein CcCBS67573_g04520 [Chytriomyces confervae]|uniref:Uncharacterized protein n=1 Tax=Chytriomyces confervae TaxID=246404 RepID=A0A507FF53_9FUNG|nr:hypothetical protein CcCBS67573_g04520 [Chytriomyces confervae]